MHMTGIHIEMKSLCMEVRPKIHAISPMYKYCAVYFREGYDS